MLREIALRLSRRLRDTDTVARVGGDEFMAIMENVGNRENAEAIAQSLLSSIADPSPYNGMKLGVTASVGISLFPGDGESAELLERNADVAMYNAKFGGYGVQSFSKALDSALIERRELELEMARALESGGFELYYQPQCTSQGVLAGLALLRFTHPVLGVVPPSRLIP